MGIKSACIPRRRAGRVPEWRTATPSHQPPHPSPHRHNDRYQQAPHPTRRLTRPNSHHPIPTTPTATPTAAPPPAWELGNDLGANSGNKSELCEADAMQILADAPDRPTIELLVCMCACKSELAVFPLVSPNGGRQQASSRCLASLLRTSVSRKDTEHQTQTNRHTHTTRTNIPATATSMASTTATRSHATA